MASEIDNEKSSQIEIVLLAEGTLEIITTAFPPFDGMANETDRSATSAGKVSRLNLVLIQPKQKEIETGKMYFMNIRIMNLPIGKLKAYFE